MPFASEEEGNVPGSFPEEILARTGRVLSAERQLIGEGSFVYVLSAERGRFVLKRDRRPEQVALREREARVLAALRDRRPFVAGLLAHTERDGERFFLFTYLPGEDMVHALQRGGLEERHQLIVEFGRTLRRIHSWQPDLPRPHDWLGNALERATRNVSAGVIPNPIAADSAYDGQDARRLLARLSAGRAGLENDIVFCHGDYCLPNVLVEAGRAVGVIDWPDGGYADRRYDLATALWTIGFNLHSREYVRPFLDGYGYGGLVAGLEFFEALYVLVA
jgi:aminoglycoside phosphotransferase